MCLLTDFVHVSTTAASLVPSDDEAIPHQLLLDPAPVTDHVLPLSLDVHRLPPDTVAVSLVPSDEEVI